MRLSLSLFSILLLSTGCSSPLKGQINSTTHISSPPVPAQSDDEDIVVLAASEDIKITEPENREIADLESKARRPGAAASDWTKLGNALMQKSRDTTVGQYYELAEAAFKKAVTLDPKYTDALVGLAWVSNSKHDFKAGKHWAEAALSIDSKLEDAYALLGDAAVELGDYDEAFEHYQAALDIRPDLSSYARAAHLLWLTGNSQQANVLMQKAIDAGGSHAENIAWCRAELAQMFLHQGAVLPAAQQADLAYQLAPNNPHVLATMGKVKAAKKDYDAAIKFYNRTVDIMPNHDVLVALGDLYMLTNRPDDAEKFYERVVSFHADHHAHSHGSGLHSHGNDQGNAQLARFFADHDRNLEEALREAELAYRNYKNIFATDTLAWCYYKNGHYENAMKTIRKALRWNTPDASILYHAGMIYAKLDERNTAKKYLYQALSLNPNFHPVYAEVAAKTLKSLSANDKESGQLDSNIDRIE